MPDEVLYPLNARPVAAMFAIGSVPDYDGSSAIRTANGIIGIRIAPPADMAGLLRGIWVNMSETRSLAMDMGAGSCRLVLGKISAGRWQLKEVGRFPTPVKKQSFGRYQCWDMGEITHQMKSHVSMALDAGAIASIGVDSWGVDYLLLDKQLEVVGMPVCYRDKRTMGVMQRLQNELSAREIYRRTGIQFLPFNTLYQLVACAEQEPDWMLAAEHFLMVPDYLHFVLSGVVSNEYTNATTTQMCNLDGKWDEALMDAIGIKRSLMQSPIAAGTVLGDGIGVARGLKVIAPATHDTASAVAGTPLQSGDEAYISSGTWSLMGIESATPIATEEARRMNFTNEGGIERRFRVLKNVMGMWLIQRVCEEAKLSSYASLLEQAEQETPWRSVIDPNALEFLNPISMTDSIRDYCRRLHQPVPDTEVRLARCIFDSLALSYRHVKQQLETLRRRKLSRIRIVGGGCQNKLLNQLCADACELPVIAGPIEASALGNLSAQMIALGVVEDLNAARSLICSSVELHEYRPKNPVPQAVLARFKELLGRTETEGAPARD